MKVDSSPDNDGTDQYRQMVRVRQARRKVYVRNQRLNAASSDSGLAFMATKVCASSRALTAISIERDTPPLTDTITTAVPALASNLEASRSRLRSHLGVQSRPE